VKTRDRLGDYRKMNPKEFPFFRMISFLAFGFTLPNSLSRETPLILWLCLYDATEKDYRDLSSVSSLAVSGSGDNLNIKTEITSRK